MTEQSSEEILRCGIDRLKITVTDQQIDLLMAYLNLLKDWNKAYNLTAVRDPKQMIIRHLLDCLSIIPHVTEQRVLDLGSGAGLPGMILAIIFPQNKYLLLDGNGKKARFLNQVKIELELENVTVVKSRAETYHPTECYPAVISRAFATIADSARLTSELLKIEGRLYAMKGKIPHDELSLLPENYSLETVQQIKVPFLEEERHLVTLIRKCR